MKQCLTCDYWHTTIITRVPQFGHVQEECRRHSPIAGIGWPKTRGDDGCGDHEYVPELRPCWICGSPIGSRPWHYLHSTTEPVCKACAEEEDAKLKQAMMPAHLAEAIERKKLYPGAACLKCNKPYEGENTWLHLSAPGDVYHYCDKCR